MKRLILHGFFAVCIGAGLGYIAAASEPRSGTPNDPDAGRACDSQKASRRSLLAVATTAVIPGSTTTTQAAKKPNIVVIWGDDIGQSNVSAYSMGMMGYRTPNIDRVAKEGMIFTDYYAEQSCTAGRASFITGQHGLRTGMTKVGIPGSSLGLQKQDPTIAELLKPLGYATGQFGKNHLGDLQRIPPDRPRLRRVLRQPLPPERRGRARASRLSQGPGISPEVRPAWRARLQGHGRRRSDRRPSVRQGRQADASRIPDR